MSETDASGASKAIEEVLPRILGTAVQAANRAGEQRRLSVKVDDEFPGSLVDLCRSVARAHAKHPAFVEQRHTFESLLQFFLGMCLRLLDQRPFEYTEVVGSPTSEADDPFRLAVHHENLRIDLTVAAFDRLIRPSASS